MNKVNQLKKNDGLDLNYLALYVCILSGKSAEVTLRRAFPEIAAANFEKAAKDGSRPSDESTLQMIEMRKTKTYEQIADYFGITPAAVFHRIKRYKERQGKGKDK